MRVIASLVVCAVMLVGCANDVPSGGGTPSAPEPTSPATTAASSTLPNTSTPSATSAAATTGKPTGTVIKSANSQFGLMLFDGTGQAIYLFDKERTTKPHC